MLAALDDQRGAFAAFAHAAAVQEVRIRKLPDAGPHDEIGVFLDLAVKGLAVAVKHDVWHGPRSVRPATARVLPRAPCSRPCRAPTAERRWRHSRDRARWCRAGASARRSRRSS